MTSEKIDKIVEVLEMINNNIIASSGNQIASMDNLVEKIDSMDPGVKPEVVIRGLLAKVQKDFEDELQEKTGWGRRELAQVMSNVLSNADKWAMKNFK